MIRILPASVIAALLAIMWMTYDGNSERQEMDAIVYELNAFLSGAYSRGPFDVVVEEE
ncbi:MAG: hypothetical protein ACREX4_20180 [Gammaproteobacteria bacterium]